MFEFFGRLGQSILNGLAYFFGVLGSFLSNSFNTLLNFLVDIFTPIIWLVKGFLYLLDRIFQIVLLILDIIRYFFTVVWALGEALFRVLTNFNYTGSTEYYRLPSQYSEGYTAVTNFLSSTGFNKIALILAVFVWIFGAILIIRIIGEKA